MPHAPSLPHRSSQPAPGPTTAPPTDVVVEARDLTKVYGSGEARVAALDGVSLTVSRGQFVAVMGPSGSGKSTLLHCLAGLDTPASGHVLIAGRDLAGMNDKQLTAVRRDQLGFVFQAFNLLPTLTAEENILLPTRLAHRTPDPNWQNAVIAALGIGDRLTHRPLSSPAASSRESPSPALSSAAPRSFSPTSPPGPSTPPRPRPSCRRWPACATTSVRPSSWSPTTRTQRPPPTA